MRDNQETRMIPDKTKTRSLGANPVSHCSLGWRENRATLQWQWRRREISGTSAHLMISLAAAALRSSQSRMMRSEQITYQYNSHGSRCTL